MNASAAAAPPSRPTLTQLTHEDHQEIPVTVHPLRAQAHCDHCGSFVKANASQCRRCNQPTAAAKSPVGARRPGRPPLSLVKSDVPVLARVLAIQPKTIDLTVTPAGNVDGGATEQAEDSAAAAEDKAPALPCRDRFLPTGPRTTPNGVELTIAEVAAGRAAMDARKLGLQIRVMDWHGFADGTALVVLPGGARVRYQPQERCLFAAVVPCLFGSHHYASIRGRLDLDEVRLDAEACLKLHADFTDWPTAAAKDLAEAFAPRLVRPITPVLPLRLKDTHPDA